MNEKEFTRRDFFGLIGHTSIGSSVAGTAVISLKYLDPNVLFEPPFKFKLEKADDFIEDSIKFIEAKKLFIINREGGFQAISAVCTHLGCTVKLAQKNQFHCPCHGSKFDKHGNVISGPAPKPLRHYKLTLSRDRYLVVNMKKEVDAKFKLIV
tara:strand:+ start:5964 stop:6422 length:459 start_codon:yes stop_codon:yes gene_type:complete